MFNIEVKALQHSTLNVQYSLFTKGP